MSADELPFANIEHVGAVILYAYEHHASDLHFESGKANYHIRMRQDGLLSSIFIGAAHNAARLNTQLKVMAELDIAEQRIPQDGRISFALTAAHHLNIRVSTCPTTYGEKIVLRLLDPKAHIPTFEELGLEDTQRTLLCQAIDRPNGLILVTGPAGSGKTTTLYSALNDHSAYV